MHSHCLKKKHLQRHVQLDICLFILQGVVHFNPTSHWNSLNSRLANSNVWLTMSPFWCLCVFRLSGQSINIANLYLCSYIQKPFLWLLYNPNSLLNLLQFTFNSWNVPKKYIPDNFYSLFSPQICIFCFLFTNVPMFWCACVVAFFTETLVTNHLLYQRKVRHFNRQPW